MYVGSQRGLYEAMKIEDEIPEVKQGEMGFFSNLIDVEGNRFGIYEIVKKSET